MFKKTLLLLGVMALATPAMATELTNPFYTPNKGHVTSVTSLEASRYQDKDKSGYNGRQYDKVLSEALSYGVTDEISVDAAISNTWMRQAPKMGISEVNKEDTNIDWVLGGTYTYGTGPVKMQGKLAYGQKESWSHENGGAYKYVRADAKAGYDFGVVLPYVQASWEMPLWASHDGADKPIYLVRGAAYKQWCDKLATDLGIAYTHFEGSEISAWTVDAEVSYFLTPDWTLGMYGNYAFDGRSKDRGTVYAEKIGLRLRTQF